MYPIRSGLTTVGMVGAKQGMQADVPSLAEVLKQQGYATGQFGKNHLGDRNEHLPTVHGFDEFYGFLYHLNVLQEPLEHHDYPQDDEFREKFAPPRDHPQLRRRRLRRRRSGRTVREGRQADRRRHGAAGREALRDARRRVQRHGLQVHGEVRQGRPAVLRLAQSVADARLHVHARRVQEEGRRAHQLRRPLHRRHDPARRRRRRRAGQARGARRRRRHRRRLHHRQRAGAQHLPPTAARRRSAARRCRPGKAASACPCSCVGRAASSRAPS